ncbi:rCG35712, isoform CRA_b [Rattus norvegicus]|uniref:RCG35712, isoform CRA_b n=1 Tax=Rattus norvegicus TaxID=10116 RepID=A6IKN2_RAT|nr:rCG35712, isoform CRA_b [Rattus norvegicus]
MASSASVRGLGLRVSAGLQPGAALRLARPAHLRGLRQEPGGQSPRGQRGQAGELRGGARPALHRTPKGLAVAAHR